MKTDYYEDYWNAQANREAGWSPSQGWVTPDERKLFAQWIKPGWTCVDYGCGDGQRYGIKLKESGVDYRGFDISACALGQAGSQGLVVEPLTADGATSMPDSSADATICFEVMEHMLEPQRAVRELKRCLKSGGHAIFSVPNAGFWTARMEFLLTGFFCPGGSPQTARTSPWCDPHIRFFTPSILRTLMQSEGLTVVQEIGEDFSLSMMPVLWRLKRVKAFLNTLSKPIGFLGKLFPSLLSGRLFIVVRKA